MQRCEDNVAARLNGNALQPLSDVSVTVTDDHTGLPAALYSDNGVTQVFQPLKTDDNGYYGFYAANGEYTLTFSGIRIATFTRKVVLNDFDDNPAVTKAELAAGSGASLVTFMQAGAGAVPLNLQTLLRGFVTLEQFGALGDGIADDSGAMQAAIAYAQATRARIHGTPGKRYKITQGMHITAGYVEIDGQASEIVNAVSNATSADPLFGITGTAISNVCIGNFRITGMGKNGHVVAVLGDLATGPQFVTVERMWVQTNAGNGKDHNGAAMPAQLFYAYGGMSIKLANCTSYLSGGIYTEKTLKLHVSDTTIDSPPAGRLFYAKNCNGVLVDSGCIFNGGITDQVEIDTCQGIKVLASRFKGGTGRQFYAHGVSSGVKFSDNQQEIYDTASSAVEVTTAVASPDISGNALAFINSSGTPTTFAKPGIAIVDEPGGGFSSTGARIIGNSFVPNSLMTIASFISMGSTLNSVQRPQISSNTLAAGGGTGATITKGIDLAANVVGAIIESNQYGATSGNTMTTGISVAASCTGTRLLENYNAGNCTTPISDAGVRSARREGGALVATSYTPIVSGTGTAGTASYTTQSGSFTRDGNMAKVDIAVAWSGHTGTGNTTVSLPFAAANKFQVLHVLSDSMSFTGQLKAAVSSGDNVVRLWAETAGGAVAQVAMDPAATLYISGTLETA